MADSLCDLRVLVLDCQAGAASPTYGDLLELGWAVCHGSGLLVPVTSSWIQPRTQRPISRAVRELTGWSSACLSAALPEASVWRQLRTDMARVPELSTPAPTVIHYARFELPWLRDLSARLEQATTLPFDIVDLHAIAARLYPALPRHNIRALAGFLGHAPGQLRRAAGHVEATAFIWQALIPRLSELGIASWPALQAFLARKEKPTPRASREYPLAPERRRALPDRPGVYRFLRRHGDVIYVGKAASLKKRVASHFARGARTTERSLEMLTQVYDIDATETASVLEAALLETDEIKRIDPPYNTQLRAGERSAWFASRDLREAVSCADPAHPVGPLPSQRALSPLAALVLLLEGEGTPALFAQALAVPLRELPESTLFDAGWRAFLLAVFDEPALPDAQAGARAERKRDVLHAARRLWLERGRQEPELAEALEPGPLPLWDAARVQRRLERNLIQCGLLLRRARWLCLLAQADVAYRERTMSAARLLRIARCEVASRSELPQVSALATLAELRAESRLPLTERKRAFDAAGYDRMRVLATELRRVLDDGGEAALRLGAHVLAGERLQRMMRDAY